MTSEQLQVRFENFERQGITPYGAMLEFYRHAYELRENQAVNSLAELAVVAMYADYSSQTSVLERDDWQTVSDEIGVDLALIDIEESLRSSLAAQRTSKHYRV